MDMARDIPRGYTAVAEWLAGIIILLVINRRHSGVVFAVTAFCALMAQTAFLVVTANLNVIFWLPSMGFAVLMMLTLIVFIGDIGFKDGVFHCVRAFIMAEFAASVEWQIHNWIWPNSEGLSYPLGAVLFVTVYAAVFASNYFAEKKAFGRYKKLYVTTRELVFAVTISLTVFAFSNLSFVTVKTPFSGVGWREVMNIRTIIDLGGLAALYSYYAACREHRANNELVSLTSILRTQYAQYQMSKENADIINRKHHDLKHQIAALRSETDAARREAYLDRMEDEIRAYEAQNKTGNPVLDTILTSKTLYCAAHGINFTCAADGSLLNSMDAMDICALFGNALDNAIESAEKLPDKKKRLICLTVARKKDFLIIRVENYFEGKVNFRDGLPMTTKGDSGYHGYGLKSVRHIAGKYGGVLTVETNGNWFAVNMLIPLKNNA